MKQKLIKTATLLTLCLALLSVAINQRAAAQDDQRDIRAKEVLQGRRQGKGTQVSQYRYRVKPSPTSNKPARIATASNRTKQSSPSFPVAPPPKDKTYITVGVTLWRVRRATRDEIGDPKTPKERMRLNPSEDEVPVVVERISDGEPVTDQDLIQIEIEYLPYQHSSGKYLAERIGYLYVVNAEMFADGKLKNARLIFPTQRTYGGDNRLLPGRKVTLPDPRRPFRLTRSQSGQVQAYETYTIIISPVPLDERLPQDIGPKAMELPMSLIAEWRNEWGGGEIRADLHGGIGRKRTERELAASGNTDADERDTKDVAEDLTQDDAPPQIVFRKAVTPGAKMLVTLLLPFKQRAASTVP